MTPDPHKDPASIGPTVSCVAMFPSRERQLLLVAKDPFGDSSVSVNLSKCIIVQEGMPNMGCVWMRGVLVCS